jgi:hypothetical protein
MDMVPVRHMRVASQHVLSLIFTLSIHVCSLGRGMEGGGNALPFIMPKVQVFVPYAQGIAVVPKPDIFNRI